MTHWRMALCGVAVLFVVACAKSDRPARVDSASGALAIQGRKQLSGDLTKPIDQYTGAEFYALVRGLKYGAGAERSRKCKGNAACKAAKPRKTRVRVDAVVDADSLGATNLAPFGVVAARARNRGSDADDMYGMKPGLQYDYYLIVVPGAAGGAATWRLEELEIRGSTREHRQLGAGKFVACNHAFVKGARADFRTCDPNWVRPASTGARMPSDGGEGYLWISCAWGCCVSEPGNPS